MSPRMLAPSLAAPADFYAGAALGRLNAVEKAMRDWLQTQGCPVVAPPALLDASGMLRLYGERTRGDAYIFADGQGGELCMRPDFTVPIATHHLERMARGAAPSGRYCYSGPAWSRERGEVRQVGFEIFGGDEGIEGDVEALTLTLQALRMAGVAAPLVEMGDTALIDAALDALRLTTGAPLPRARQTRLRRHYWRPAQFRALMSAYSRPGEGRLAFIDSLPRVARFAALTALSGREPDAEARAVLADVIEEAGGPLIGQRPLEEIVARLREEAEDAFAPALSQASLAFMEGLLDIDCPAVEAPDRLEALAKETGVKAEAAVETLRRRAQAMNRLIGASEKLRFRGIFRSKMEYYSGFLFRIRMRSGEKILASGGRYGELLQAMGAPQRIPAIGATIFANLIAPPDPRPTVSATAESAAPDDHALLRLGLPSKGRLREQLQERFARAGLTVTDVGRAREYAARLEGLKGIELRLMSAGEIAHRLAAGEIDAGVTGEDLVHEEVADWRSRLRKSVALGFGRADLVAAAPQCWADVSDMSDLDDVASHLFAATGAPLRVATKYVNLTREFFEERGVVNYVIVESLGATEAAPGAGSADVIVDITSTGETLRDNHLKILTHPPMLASQACLYASTRPMGARAAAALQALEARLKG
ncbi:ATP phosphoribosyltransferase [Neomegalonema sp.]|uniref:ATP phosphoribosyltransferase n=1 Tax=Neomegalonema sp. TaxID=2039713 RepID=UPI002630B246|nr:ATP phosphoribosyltransferase [Neomegalonema sp.]MDD2870187.1 ATP phosphoribosyltransferase [Neomegalonema sp.]